MLNIWQQKIKTKDAKKRFDIDHAALLLSNKTFTVQWNRGAAADAEIRNVESQNIEFTWCVLPRKVWLGNDSTSSNL
jgi:hypothetical protein